MYFFYFGSHHQLSAWELGTLIDPAHWQEGKNGVFVANRHVPALDWQAQLARLGGIREVILLPEVSSANWAEAVRSFDLEWLGTNKEVTLLAPSCSEEARSTMLSELKRHIFEQSKLKIRFRVNKTYLVEEDGLVLWWMADNNNQMYLGRAIAQQTVQAYSERDYDKPARSMQRGMLPPKLAQIMVNGAKVSNETLIWDPFCGTGTVVIEAALIGHRVCGSDVDAKAIIETQKNTEALVPAEKQHLIEDIWQQDCTKTWLKEPTAPCVIVAEGYLGPPLSKALSRGEELQHFWQRVEPIYQQFFLRLRDSAIKKMVLVTPITVLADGTSRLAKRSWDILSQAGWVTTFTADYIRTDQFVGRQVTMVEKLT
ncbi:hypothetical protein KBB08_02400 [Candidatus Gracilibacteria bacterium]|nr:hypothetical protein [Candidatus Gracilibacteria bacterium]